MDRLGTTLISILKTFFTRAFESLERLWFRRGDNLILEFYPQELPFDVFVGGDFVSLFYTYWVAALRQKKVTYPREEILESLLKTKEPICRSMLEDLLGV